MSAIICFWQCSSVHHGNPPLDHTDTSIPLLINIIALPNCFISLYDDFFPIVIGKLRCHCSPTHECPSDHENGTCVTEGHCFRKVEIRDGYELHSYGCMPPESKTRMQCKTKNDRHYDPKTLLCCNSRDLCNIELDPTLPPPTTVAPGMYED